MFVLAMGPYVNVSADVRLSGLEAINFGTWSGGGNVDNNDRACAYRSDGNHKYKVTFTDDSTVTPGVFHLENVAKTAALPMLVKWKNTPVDGGGVITYGVEKNTKNADIIDALCATNGDSANLKTKIFSTDLEGMPAGTYSAEISVQMEPR